MGVGAGAGATQGVLGNTGTSSDGERRGVADGGVESCTTIKKQGLITNEWFLLRVFHK